MEERPKQDVEPERGERAATTLDAGDVISIVDAERVASRSVSANVIHLDEAGQEPGPSEEARLDPNTGMPIAHPSVQEPSPRSLTAAEQDAPLGDGRLRDYLRLVEGP
jgi:hypothetical protein